VAVLTFALSLAVLGIATNDRILSDEIRSAYDPTVGTGDVTPSGPVFHFGSDVDLIGYQISPDRLGPGGSVSVDLTWRAVRPASRDWRVALVALGEDNQPLAKVQSWPQGGRAPTEAWQTGQVYRDYYVLTPAPVGTTQVATIWLSLFDADPPYVDGLPVLDARGEALGKGLPLGEVKLVASGGAPTPAHAIDVRFGPSIDLVGDDAAASAGQLALTLDWRARAPVATSYTVFVHVVDAQGRIVAQQDGPPRAGKYPTTAWDPGEIVPDTRTIPLPSLSPGRYAVLVGLYDPGTGVRLPTSGSGSLAPDDAVRVFEFQR
jgi:hypothetical protein